MFLLGATGALIAWRAGSRLNRAIVLGAAVAALLGGLLLLFTNHEIAYVALAAFLVLTTALWIGFGVPAHGRTAWLALGLPAAFIAAVAGESAWRGERSQYGQQARDRAEFVAAEQCAPLARYFGATQLPAATVRTLTPMAERLPPASNDGTRAVLYGPGCEFLERLWPGVRRPGQALWMHPGTSVGPREAAALATALTDGSYRAVWAPTAWNHWPTAVEEVLRSHFENEEIGLFTAHAALSRAWAFRDGIEFNNAFGGNANARLLVTHAHVLGAERTTDGVPFLGTREAVGELEVSARAHILRVDPVLQRLPPDDPRPVRATFEVRSLDDTSVLLWSATLETAAGEAVVRADQKVHPNARGILLRVVLDPASVGHAIARWRAPFILHAFNADEPPPRIRPLILPNSESSAAVRAALLRCDWRPDDVVVRGVEPRPDGLHISAGGEAWMRSTRALSEFRGVVRIGAADARPTVRIVFRKGHRFELLDQFSLSPEQPSREFRGWFPEGEGWFGVLIDPHSGPAVVQVTSVTPAP